MTVDATEVPWPKRAEAAIRSLRDVETLVVLARTHLRARALFLQLRESALGAAELLAQS